MTSGGGYYDAVIICEYAADIIKKELADMGIQEDKIFSGDSLFETLDETLSVERYRKGRRVVVFGEEKKAKAIMERMPADSMFISVKNSEDAEGRQHILDIIASENCFFVNATENFEIGICLLEDAGLKVNEDFMDGELFLMPLYSEMLRETIYAVPKDNADCEMPFFSLIIDGKMNPYPCCPSGIIAKWVNRERLYYKSCKELWTSMWFKIYRLSMINKTYCFCNEHFCNRLKVNAGITDKRAEMVTREFPTDMQVEFDYTCNLHCPSCRSGVAVATPERKRLLDAVVKDFRDQGIMDRLEWTRLAGYGDVFASKYYQELLYSDKKRKNLFLITNGVLFTEDKFDRLPNCYENIDIYISIDAACQKTYEKLRPGGDWHKLQNNLHMIAKKKQQGLVRRFVIQMVVQEDNYKEIPDFVRMGKELGVSYVYMNSIRRWGHMSEEEFAHKTILEDDYSVKEKVRKYLEDPEVMNSEKGFVNIDFMK